MSVPRPAARPVRRFASERGSMLLTAMLFATGMALVLGSYLALSRTSLKVAHRTYFANDAVNLAEAGVEEALYSFNLLAAGTAPATAWSGWTLTGTNAMRTLPTFNREQNGIGVVKVYVSGYDGSNTTPKVIAQAVITPFDGGAPISKTLQMTLSLTTGKVAPGLVALNGIQLAGSSFVDSFNSNPTNLPAGPWLPYSGALAKPNAAVVVLAGSITVAKGLINGNLYLGTGVAPLGSSDLTGKVIPDYKATFPLPAFPTAASLSHSYDLGTKIPVLLPRLGDLPAADGRYYYFCNKTTVQNFAITAARQVTIVGTDTDMSAGITLPATSTLQVYIDGPLKLTGGEDLNPGGWAGALRIYTTTTKNCTVGNKSQLVAWLQAPNAQLRATGGDDTSLLVGYFMADTIYASGSMDFHYDESLQPAGTGAGTTWKQTGWLELQSAADRATVAAQTGNYLR